MFGTQEPHAEFVQICEPVPFAIGQPCMSLDWQPFDVEGEVGGEVGGEVEGDVETGALNADAATGDEEVENPPQF